MTKCCAHYLESSLNRESPILAADLYTFLSAPNKLPSAPEQVLGEIGVNWARGRRVTGHEGHGAEDAHTAVPDLRVRELCARRESVRGSWGKAMRDAVRNTERWEKGKGASVGSFPPLLAKVEKGAVLCLFPGLRVPKIACSQDCLFPRLLVLKIACSQDCVFPRS